MIVKQYSLKYYLVENNFVYHCKWDWSLCQYYSSSKLSSLWKVRLKINAIKARLCMFWRNSIEFKTFLHSKRLPTFLYHMQYPKHWHSKYILQPLTKRDSIHIKSYFSQQIFGMPWNIDSTNMKKSSLKCFKLVTLRGKFYLSTWDYFVVYYLEIINHSSLSPVKM